MFSSSVGFVGGGRVARILLGGWRRAGVNLENIVVSEPEAAAIDRLRAVCDGMSIVGGDNAAAARQDIVFLAVHVPAIPGVLGEIAQELGEDAIVVSLAPKFTFAKLSAALDGFDRLVRMIPNAASIVGDGLNPIAWSGGLPDSDRSCLIDLLKPLGQYPVVPESALEAYAIVTAMGPTYFWPQWTELVNIGTQFGLTLEDSRAGVQAMLAGAVKTLFESGMTDDEVLDLIPVKPLAEFESTLLEAYRTMLPAVMEKIRP